MPSIPQSLLWVSLVVLWLFVLVPMLISKRDAVRRTSDVALATRVLTSGASARLGKRPGPASGHRSDPDWRPAPESLADLDGQDGLDDLDEGAAESGRRVAVMTVATGTTGAAERDYLDVDVVEAVVEEGPAAPAAEVTDQDDQTDRIEVGATRRPEVAAGNADSQPGELFATEDVDDDGIDDVDGVPGSRGVPGNQHVAADETPTVAFAAQRDTTSARRHRHDSAVSAAVTARKYQFRKRTITVLTVLMLVAAVLAFTVTSAAWWLCAVAGTVTVLYLGYLRRQTRIEDQVRRRRAQRMARSRLGVENTADRDMDIVPARLRQPGTAVLEIDDEDPVFEHLEHAPVASEQDWASTLPRAAGQ